MPNSNRRDDDVDDFMASILGGQSAVPQKQSVFTHRKPQRPVHHTSPLPSPTPVRAPNSSSAHRRTKRPLKIITSLFIIALLAVGGFFLWKGPVSSLLTPKSPFSEKQKEDMGIPLYYPTKLPGTFKIETNSITQSEVGVLLYAITDNDGKRINITLQKQPEGLNLEPLYSSLQDIRDIDTKFGKVKVGVSGENISITNILTGETWVIISSPEDIIGQNLLTEIINSLKA